MSPRPGLALVALGLMLSACSSGSGAPASVPSASSSATAVAAPSAAESGSGSVETDWSVLPDLGTYVTATAPLLAGWPTGFASATTGGVWLPNGNEGAPPAVARLDPDTLEVTATIGLDGAEDSSPPDAWATAPSANGVWVALAHQRAVALLDPATNSVSRRIEFAGVPYSMVEDGDSLWIVDFENSTVIRLDVASGEELLRVETVLDPIEIAVGEEGVWVTEHRRGNLVRLDPDTGDMLATLPVGGRPGVAIGFGSVWARSDDDRVVSRIDPTGNRIVATVPIPGNPVDLAIAGDSVWVVATPQRGACEVGSYLVRIDPQTNQVAALMNLPCAFGLATDGSRLWAGSFDGEQSSIIRIDAGAD